MPRKSSKQLIETQKSKNKSTKTTTQKRNTNKSKNTIKKTTQKLKKKVARTSAKNVLAGVEDINKESKRKLIMTMIQIFQKYYVAGSEIIEKEDLKSRESLRNKNLAKKKK